MTVWAGTRLGHYKILSPLGKGGLSKSRRMSDGQNLDEWGWRFSHCLLPAYSCRSATIGSTFVARRAGR